MENTERKEAYFSSNLPMQAIVGAIREYLKSQAQDHLPQDNCVAEDDFFWREAYEDLYNNLEGAWRFFEFEDINEGYYNRLDSEEEKTEFLSEFIDRAAIEELVKVNRDKMLEASPFKGIWVDEEFEDKDTMIIASRHPATIDYLQRWAAEQGYYRQVADTNLTVFDVKDRVVVGNLPMHIAAACRRFIAVILPDDMPRGVELDKGYIERNISLVEYEVRKIEEF